MFISNSAYIGRLYFYSLTLAIRPALASGRPPRRLAVQCPPQGRRERPARPVPRRSLATRPQRAAGRRNLSTCLINGEPHKQARDRHKERPPRPRLPLSPGLCGWDNGGARGASQGLGPFSLGGAGPGEPPPASLPPCSLSWGLQVSGWGCPHPFRGTGWGRTRPGKTLIPEGVETAPGASHPGPASQEPPAPSLPCRPLLSPWLQAGLAQSLCFY